jgi:acetylcholinesterase
VTIDDFNRFLTNLVPNMTRAAQDAARALYLDPASQESIWERTTAFISDAVFTCNAQVVASHAACGDETFRYIFAVPPAKHGDDVPYTFYSNGDNPTDAVVANKSVASVLQHIITSLTITGAPESAPHMPLEKYGVKQNILVVNETSVDLRAGDPWHSNRCVFWQNAIHIQG